jgi:hypothetical protein
MSSTEKTHCLERSGQPRALIYPTARHVKLIRRIFRRWEDWYPSLGLTDNGGEARDALGAEGERCALGQQNYIDKVVVMNPVAVWIADAYEQRPTPGKLGRSFATRFLETDKHRLVAKPGEWRWTSWIALRAAQGCTS